MEYRIVAVKYVDEKHMGDHISSISIADNKIDNINNKGVGGVGSAHAR